jgi:hypothetical protein
MLESAQRCIAPGIRAKLHDDKTARNEERAPNAVEEEHGEHPVWHNEILPLRAQRKVSSHGEMPQ